MEAIIFDLDGVLISSREWHFETLNKALQEVDSPFVITKEEHELRFDGLSTTTKLSILHEERGLPKDQFDVIWQRKQEYTLEIIEQKVHYSNHLVTLLSHLSQNYQLACCSNSIMTTLNRILIRLGIAPFFKEIIGNNQEDWMKQFPNSKPKPHPSMFLYACLKLGCSPQKTLICEDSPIGRQAALESGCWLCPIEDPSQLTLEYILPYLNVDIKPRFMLPYQCDINVVIPMAGRGSRFVDAGYKDIKPLILVKSQYPMIQVVIRNLHLQSHHILLCQSKHIQDYALSTWLPTFVPNVSIVPVNKVTDGAACTVLLAEKEIDNEKPLFIVNSDQYVIGGVHGFLYHMQKENADGGILCFYVEDLDPKWSYVQMKDNGEKKEIKSVQEKNPISHYATVGMYYWKHGSEFVRCAKKFVSNAENKINNEYYVAPIYNILIQEGKRVIRYDIETMYGLGTPNDLKRFESEFEGIL